MLWWNIYHAFIIRKVNNDSIEVLESNNHPANSINNNTWSYKDLAGAFSGGSVYLTYLRRYHDRGFTIYRYIGDIPGGGGGDSGGGGNNDNQQKHINITTDSTLPSTTKTT